MEELHRNRDAIKRFMYINNLLVTMISIALVLVAWSTFLPVTVTEHKYQPLCLISSGLMVILRV